MNTFVSNNNITAFNTLLRSMFVPREKKYFGYLFPRWKVHVRIVWKEIKTERLKTKTNDLFPITYFVMVLVKSCAL